MDGERKLTVRLPLQRGVHDHIISTFEAAKGSRSRSDAVVHCVELGLQACNEYDVMALDSGVEFDGGNESADTYVLAVTLAPGKHAVAYNLYQQVNDGNKVHVLTDYFVLGYRALAGPDRAIPLRSILRHLWHNEYTQGHLTGDQGGATTERKPRKKSAANQTRPEQGGKPVRATPMSQAPLDLGEENPKPTPAVAAKPSKPASEAKNWSKAFLDSA